jgi:hypothetical protein
MRRLYKSVLRRSRQMMTFPIVAAGRRWKIYFPYTAFQPSLYFSWRESFDKLVRRIPQQRLGDTISECRVAYHLSWPELLKQFVSGDYALMMSQEVGKKSEDLWFKRNDLSASSQLIELFI